MARAVGVSYRQLDYWERTGLMASTRPPSGSGSRARLDLECAKAVGVLAALFPHTFSLTGPGCTPSWERIRAAVGRGGRFALDPASGYFAPEPVDADVVITVDVDRIAKRVEDELADEQPAVRRPG